MKHYTITVYTSNYEREMSYAEYLERDIDDVMFCVSVFDVIDGEVGDSSDDYIASSLDEAMRLMHENYKDIHVKKY